MKFKINFSVSKAKIIFLKIHNSKTIFSILTNFTILKRENLKFFLLTIELIYIHIYGLAGRLNTKYSGFLTIILFRLPLKG